MLYSSPNLGLCLSELYAYVSEADDSCSVLNFSLPDPTSLLVPHIALIPQKTKIQPVQIF